MTFLLTVAMTLFAQAAPQSKCSPPYDTAWAQEDVVGNVRELRIEEIHYSHTRRVRELTRAVKFSRAGQYLQIEQPGYLPSMREGPPPALYVFDSDCRPIERKESIVSEGIVRTVFRYDERGRQIESAGLDDEGRLVYRKISWYGPDGKLEEQIRTIRVHPEHYRPPRFDVYRNTRSSYRYEPGQNQEEQIDYDYTGKYYARYERHYNSKGRLKEETRYDAKNQAIEHDVRIYAGEVRLIAEEQYDSFFYGRGRNLVPGTIRTKVGFFQTGSRYEYIFDSHGNWVEKRGYKISEDQGNRNRTLDSVTYRTIAYYD